MPAEHGKSRTVLVIDDEPEIHDLFKKTLGPRGIRVVTALDPEEGTGMARDLVPDVIFISLMFTDSNGLKVSKTIHSDEELKDVPIVVLISYAGELDPKYTTTIGIVDVIVKPLSERDIIDKTVDILGKETPALPTAAEGAAWDIWEKEMETLETEEEIGVVAAEEDRPEEPVTERRESFEGGSADFGNTDKVAADLPEKKVFEAEEEENGEPEHPWFEEEEKSFAGSRDSEESAGEETKEPDDTTTFLRETESLQDETEEGAHKEKIPESLFESNLAQERPVRKRVAVAGASAVLICAVALAGYFLFSRLPEKTPTPRPVVTSMTEQGPQAEKVKTEDVVPGLGETTENTVKENAPREEAPAQKTGKMPAGGSKHTVAASASLPTETKTLNEGLKGPKDNQGQKKAVYSVQVGAFKSKGNAKSLVGKMKKKGYEAVVFTAPGEDLHRVLLGSFTDRKKAAELATKVTGSENLKAVIYRH